MEIWDRSQFQTKLLVELTVEMHGEDSMMITQLPHLTVERIYNTNHLSSHSLASCGERHGQIALHTTYTQAEHCLEGRSEPRPEHAVLVPPATIQAPLTASVTSRWTLPSANPCERKKGWDFWQMRGGRWQMYNINPF